MNKSVFVLLLIAVFCITFSAAETEEEGVILPEDNARTLVCWVGGAKGCNQRCRSWGYRYGKCSPVAGICSCHN